jgi:hypothetical protein
VGGQILRKKLSEWLRRYMVAEFLGTVVAVVMAWIAYEHSQNYLAAAAAGFVGEGIGFYGYFIIVELRTHHVASKGLDMLPRLWHVVSKSSSNLFVEFAPAGLVSSFFILPLAMYVVPQYVQPYALGFFVGKFSSDAIFYSLAIAGYEFKKWRYRKRQLALVEETDQL